MLLIYVRPHKIIDQPNHVAGRFLEGGHALGQPMLGDWLGTTALSNS